MSNLPDRSLVWLWGHCRAIGMAKNADPSPDINPMATDIALFTETLRAELAAWKEEARIQVGNRDYWKFEYDLKQLELANLRAELAEAKLDAERLDLLDTQRQPIVDSYGGREEQELIGYGWGVEGQCETVREAIDAALKGEKP